MFNIKKYAYAAVIVLCLAVCFCTSVCAVEEETSGGKIVDICVLKGNLYYCDHIAGKVVMKNVSPAVESEKGKEIAKAMEYTEIDISGGALYMSDGTKAEYDWLNNNADDIAYVFVAQLQNGDLRIMYFQFK